MRCIYLLLLMFFGGSVFLGCAGSNNEGEAPAVDFGAQEKVYVEAAEPDPAASSGDKVVLKVTGNLPSPAYTFNRFDIRVKDDVIVITPLADYDSTKMAAQVLVPFEEVCTVENLQPGRYKVEIHGRGNAVVRTETIDVKK